MFAPARGSPRGTSGMGPGRCADRRPGRSAAGQGGHPRRPPGRRARHGVFTGSRPRDPDAPKPPARTEAWQAALADVETAESLDHYKLAFGSTDDLTEDRARALSMATEAAGGRTSAQALPLMKRYQAEMANGRNKETKDSLARALSAGLLTRPRQSGAASRFRRVAAAALAHAEAHPAVRSARRQAESAVTGHRVLARIPGLSRRLRRRAAHAFRINEAARIGSARVVPQPA